MKICGQRPINFLRDYWLELIIFFIIAFSLPSIEMYIIEFIISISSPEIRPILIILGIIAYFLGIWEAWNRVIGKKFSIS